jgi:hypothetical protein
MARAQCADDAMALEDLFMAGLYQLLELIRRLQ